MTLQELARLKAKNATYEQCKYAIADCHVTLKIMQLDYNHVYSQKLWAEIDAYRDRKMALEKNLSKVRSSGVKVSQVTLDYTLDTAPETV